MVRQRHVVDAAVEVLSTEITNAIAVVNRCQNQQLLRDAANTIKDLARATTDGASLIAKYMRHQGPGEHQPCPTSDISSF